MDICESDSNAFQILTAQTGENYDAVWRFLENLGILRKSQRLRWKKGKSTLENREICKARSLCSIWFPFWKESSPSCRRACCPCCPSMCPILPAGESGAPEELWAAAYNTNS